MLGAKLEEPRTTVQIGAGKIERRPPGARRDVYINDGMEGERRTKDQGQRTKDYLGALRQACRLLLLGHEAVHEAGAEPARLEIRFVEDLEMERH